MQNCEEEQGSSMTRSLILGLAVILAGVAHAAAARHLQQVGRPRPTPISSLMVCCGRVETGGECGRPRGMGGGMHGFRGASGDALARGPGYPES